MAETATETIATSLAALMTHYYGHGPTASRAIWTDDVVVVILEETFSVAEKRLIELGQVEEVKNIRRTFQADMAEDFRQIVEQATGRKVVAFISDTDVKAALAVELFILGDGKTDMDAFEEEPTRRATERSNEP